MECEETQDRFRKNVFDKRRELGLTQKQLSDRAGINRCYLSEIECGKSVPSIVVAEKISDALDCNIEELFL